jgi:hypothetical protein
MSKRVIFTSATFLLAAVLIGSSYAAKHTLADERVTVSFDGPLQNPAKEVLKIYPAVRGELLKDLGWRTDFRPEIVLIKETASFRRVADSDLVTAVAIPKRNLIVIDYSKMNVHPFTLRTTLKHELCHLELHNHIGGGNLPRWLDEGICQWVTGGLAEIMATGSHSILREAALSNRLISLEGLEERFPKDGRDLLLAYEESRSIVDYITREFGGSRVRSILESMSKDDNLESAVRKSLLISLVELEKRWRLSIIENNSWFSYISDNFYEMFFLLAALITVCGFFRILKKKREYKDEEEGLEEEKK